ncbi:MAG TPA: hypothetical protein VF112_03370, partial [Candidatus Dormibacteraeota bacterium]
MTLEVERIDPAALVCPAVTVTCEVAGTLLDGGDLRYDPRGGGGAAAPAEHRREALAFGLVNTAYHAQRGLETLAKLLGRPLPPLRVCIGRHATQRPDWGGGHYRLPAAQYSSLPEDEPPVASGEIHLGTGGRLVPLRGERYLHSASHDPSIVLHELGHHLTRHTADFRVNRRRPPQAQANMKTPLDEGTSDYVAAILLDTADIYGWHRATVAPESPRRRCLAAPWTMAQFVGGHLSDPHTDGTIWSAALWAARTELCRRGVEGARFDSVVIRALDRVGTTADDLPIEGARQLRRRYALALEAILEEDSAHGGAFGAVVEPVFAARGIEVGFGNDALR